MKKRKIVCSAVVFCLLFLAGCGKSLPQMTQEQENAIVEYAADIVMRYTKDYDSRLVDLSLYEEKEEDIIEEPDKEAESGGMDDVADTEIIDAVNGENSGTLDDLLLPEGVTITYNGSRVVDTYPDNGDETPYFALDASTGNKLLVLEFVLHNTQSEEVQIDIFSLAPQSVIAINDTEHRNILSTMLLDDLSTYIGKLGANEEISLVMLAEVDENYEASAETLRLMVKTDDGSVAMTLQGE